jgi:hypothetical protein
MLGPQQAETEVAHPQTASILFNLAINPEVATDMEAFLGLASAALAYLSHDVFQAELISSTNVSAFLAAFYTAEAQYDPNMAEDSEQANQLKDVRSVFIQVLADVSANPTFPFVYPLGSPTTATLQSWIQLRHPRLQSAACLALGNLSRSDEMSVALVKTAQVHLPVVAILKDPQMVDSQVLHSALSFLKNLAIPPQNKPALGETGLFQANVLPRIWSLDVNPQVQFSAVSLTRLLLVNCPTNVRLICAPLSTDPLLPGNEMTQLQRLITAFSRTDAEPTKMEAARAVAAICRVLHTTPVLPILPEWDPSEEGFIYRPPKPLSPPNSQYPSPGSDGSGGGGRRERFYRLHPLINKPLSYLISQSKFPVVRSETWFVFALMGRSRDGATVVSRVLQINEAFQALAEAVTGRSAANHQGANATTLPGGNSGAQGNQPASMAMIDDLGLEPQQVDPQQAANMARVDRENALVLVSELVRNWGDELPIFRRPAFQELLKEGGELLAVDRDSKGKGIDLG